MKSDNENCRQEEGLEEWRMEGVREGSSSNQYLLPSLLFWGHPPLLFQGNKNGEDYENKEHSATVTKPLPVLSVAVPSTKLEQQNNTPVSLFEYGGGKGARVALEEKDTIYYVNPKQYHGILRRRLSRAKINESLRQRARKPYLHESRHLHAMRRVRGCGGRFLNTKTANPKTSNILFHSSNHPSLKAHDNELEGKTKSFTLDAR